MNAFHIPWGTNIMFNTDNTECLYQSVQYTHFEQLHCSCRIGSKFVIHLPQWNLHHVAVAAKPFWIRSWMCKSSREKVDNGGRDVSKTEVYFP